MSDPNEFFLPQDPLARAKMLEVELVAACEGSWDKFSRYVDLRHLFMQDPMLKSLLPEFVIKCRDLDHFWPYIKNVSPKWAPRRLHVRDAMSNLFEYLERQNFAPIDYGTSDTLRSFDASGVHSVWAKAIERRNTDPEGAITTARTLLETVCKRVLDELGTPYAEKADLPDLYKMVAKNLNIAPSQHTEDVFKRILGGCSSVVEGLGTLRNKISDAHGRGNKNPVRPLPRHAELAVNLAGAMATYIVQTWEARSS